MGFFRWIKETWSKMFLKREAEEVYSIDLQDSVIDSYIQKWYDITSGHPYWEDEEDDIESVNFAQYIDEVTSGLVTLDIGVTFPESDRGKYLKNISDYVIQKMDEKTADALGNAGIMFKPNGTNVDYYYPGSFIPTEWDSNGNILGCMFVKRKYKNKKVYTKFEHHGYKEENNERIYVIQNKAYVSNSYNSKGEPCKLSAVDEWKDIVPLAKLSNVDIPLFVYYANPKPNFIDKETPLKTPIWGNCEIELRDLDIAWSRKGTEVADSKHMTFIPQQAVQFANQHNIKLPRWIKGLNTGNINECKVDEHVATLLTEQRIKDINSILAMISTKLGYDQGFFVLDEKTGMVTATQIEADDQSTIRTIKNLRDPLKEALIKLFYASSKLADMNTQLPVESWCSTYENIKESLKDAFHFGDITYSYEEDKMSWWKYRVQGDVPPWLYYVKFEGMSEEEAKAMIEEAQPKEPTLFGSEE